MLYSLTIKDSDMKKRNLLHFVECVLLIPLLIFFALFMKMRSDLFFTFTLIFSGIAAAAQIILLYIVADSDQPHPCKLIPVDVSDLIFLYYLLQTGLAMLFLVLHNLGDFSAWTAFAVYLLLLVVTILLLVLPAPSDPPAPAPVNEADDVSDKKLRYYANYLRKLSGKCQYEALNEQMLQIAELLPRLDTAYSVQLQALEDDISSKCVQVENALLTGEHTKLPLLAREMEVTLQHIQKRIDDYRYLLTDEGFCHEDDEIANGQIDLLLDKLGLEYEEDLATLSVPFEEEFFYRKALLFATPEYKELLAGYNLQISERIAQEKAEKAARRDHRLRYLRGVSHGLAILLIVLTVALPLYWHLILRPQGFQVIPDEENPECLVVTGYNSFYGKDLVVPATLNGKKIISVGRDSLKDGVLTSVTLEEGIERLEYQSLRDNSNITDLYLPKSLKEIGPFATFQTYNQNAEWTIHYAGSVEDWNAIKIDVNGNKLLEDAQKNAQKGAQKGPVIQYGK